jgi:ABC-type multidrug transport system fused ATPase/permease subunit
MGGLRGGGMAISMSAERSPRGGGARAGQDGPPQRKPSLKKLWPQIKSLLAPRLGLLTAGLGLMVVNRVAGLVLPYTSKPLLDKVLNQAHPRPDLLPRFIALVFTAMVVQAITSFLLTQLLSKAGQRLIAEMRRQVQRHVGLLSVSYYDENRTGTLVARIMTDVEGVRNLVGTGLVDFVGGLLTAVLAFLYLLHRSVTVTLTVFAVVGAFVFVLRYAFKVIRPIFRERGRINAEVTGRLTESLGGVRVIKGYHAEEREAGVFSAGVERLLANVMKSLTMTSTLSAASTTVLGLVSAIVMWLGGHQVLANTWTIGDYFSYNMFLAFMIAPVFQVVNIGTQLTEAFAGLDRTSEIMAELEENQSPLRTLTMPPIQGTVRFEEVEFSYEAEKPVLHGVSFQAEPGTVTALVGSSGSGKSTIINLLVRLPHALPGPRAGGRNRPGAGGPEQLSAAVGRGAAGFLPLRRDDPREHSVFKTRRHRGAVSLRLPHGPRGRVRRALPRGLRHHRRRARREALRRAAPAALDCPGSLGRAAHSDSRRGHQFARLRIRGDDPGRAEPVDAGAHDLRHRSPAVDDPPRRPDSRGRGGRIVERGSHEELFALQGRYYDLYTRQHGLEANLFLAPGEGDAVEGDAGRGVILVALERMVAEDVVPAASGAARALQAAGEEQGHAYRDQNSEGVFVDHEP